MTRPNTEHPEKSDETPILSEENYMELIQLEKNDHPAKFVRIKFLDIETQDFEAIFAVCSLATLRIIGLKRSQNNDRLELLQTHEISNRVGAIFSIRWTKTSMLSQRHKCSNITTRTGSLWPVPDTEILSTFQNFSKNDRA